MPPTPDTATLQGQPTRFPVTISLAFITLAMFMVEYRLGGTTDLTAHTRLGVLRTDLVFNRGEWFRLLTPMFLHHGPVHFAFNGLAFIQLCPLVEYVFGSTRTLVTYIASALGCTLISAIMIGPSPIGSLGASGAILGLAGLLVGATWWADEPWRKMLRAVLGQRLLCGVVLTFGLGLALLLIWPIIDNWGHLGGFATGLVLSLRFRRPTEASRTLAAVSGALVGATAGALVWMMVDGHRAAATLDTDLAEIHATYAAAHPDTWTAVASMYQIVTHYDNIGETGQATYVLRDLLSDSTDPATPARLVGLLVESPHDSASQIALDRWMELAPEDPEAYNAMAWFLVTRTVLDRDPITARPLSIYSLELLAPDEDVARSLFLDTLAVIEFQLGHIDAAVLAQRQACELADELGLDVHAVFQQRLEGMEQGELLLELEINQNGWLPW